MTGILQAELALFQGDLANALGVSYLALGGVASAVPLVLIVAITVVRGRGRMARGELLAKLPWPGDGRRSPLLLLGAAVIIPRVTMTFKEGVEAALVEEFVPPKIAIANPWLSRWRKVRIRSTTSS